MKKIVSSPVRFLHRHGAEIVSLLTILSLVMSSLPYSAAPAYAATYTKTWNSTNTTNFANNPSGYLSGATTTVASGIDGSGGTIAMSAPAAQTVTENFAGTPSSGFHLDSTASPSGLDSGLVGWWPMDGVNGTSVPDASGGGYTGTTHGSPTLEQGKFGAGMLFNGNSQYADLGAVTPSLPATFSLWMQIPATSSAQRLLTHSGSSVYNGFQLVETTSGSSNVFSILLGDGVGCSSAHRQNFNISGTYAANTWHHVVVVVNSISSVSAYIDGTSKTVTNDGTGTGASYGYFAGAHLDAGGTPDFGCGNASYGAGVVDDVRVYNRALSSTEVTSLYNQTASSDATVSGGVLKRNTGEAMPTDITSTLTGFTNTTSYGLYYDSAYNRLYFTNDGTHTMEYLPFSTSSTTLSNVTGGGLSQAISGDTSGKIYYSAYVGYGTSDAHYYDPSGGNTVANSTSYTASGLPSPLNTTAFTNYFQGVAASTATGKLYSYDVSGNFMQYNPSGGATTTISGAAWRAVDSNVGPKYDSTTGKVYGLGVSGGQSKFMSVAVDSSPQTVTYGSANLGSETYDRPPMQDQLALDTADHILAYMKSNYYSDAQEFLYLDYSSGLSGTPTNLQTALHTALGISTSNPSALMFDTSSNLFYFANSTDLNNNGYGHAGSWNPAAGSSGFNDLTYLITGAISTSTWNVVLNQGIAQVEDKIYWSIVDSIGHGHILLSTPPSTTQYAYSTTTASSTSGGISQARISSNTDSAGTGSITYYLSNDGGATWNTATPGSYVTFASTGNDLRYKIKLTGNATVTSFNINYIGLYSTATLMNLKLDGSGASTDAQWVSLGWNATMPANTSVQFRTRGATNADGLDALYSATWSATTTATTTGTSGVDITGNLPGGGATPAYRYLEIEVILNSLNGIATPSVSSVTATYAINGAPDFEADYPSAGAAGAASYQNATSSDSNWGKIAIDYAVRDSDTTSGTVNAGCIEPSFEYSLDNGSTWASIPSGDLTLTTGTGGCASGYQPVSEGSYAAYTAFWNATSTAANQYSTTAKVRVTADDHEAVNNTGTTTTAAFTLDTTAPTATLAINGESSTSTVTATLSDDTTLKDYLLSNNSDYSADGSNGTSGSWQSTSGSSQTLNIPWTLSGSNTNTVYFKARDTSGNVYTGSVVAPATASTTELDDVSNTGNQTFQLFYSWAEFTSAAGATFSRYDIWRSTDGATYTHLANITDSTQNYYFDTGLASTTTYYYKVRTVDTDGDMSAFSAAQHVQPSTGGSSRNPVISNVQIPSANIRTSSAQITWDTDIVSNAEVDYSDAAGVFTTAASSSAYGTSHSVYITGLTAGVTYYFQVKSTSPSGGATTDNNGGNGYSFTTGQGPVISNTAASSITNNSATITWNTDTDSNSYVIYSTDSNLAATSSAGSASLIGTTTTPGVYTHTVTLTSLSTATTYYFYVTSTDGSSNTTTDNNLGSYYSFRTTQDTTPPTISDISEPVLSSDTAVVVWTTDEPATSQLEYGTTASTTHGSYASQTSLDSTLNLTHVATLSSLTATTPYYFRALSADAAGNATVSDENTFTTSADGTTIIIIKRTGSSSSGDTTSQTPVISKVTVDPINSLDATVHVSVAPASQVVVSYGPTTDYGYTAANVDFSTDAAVKLQNLQPGTEYHFVVDAVSDSGKRARSSDQTFTTKFLAEDLGNLSTIDKINEVQDKLKNIIESALPSINPPFITNPKVSGITTDSATVSWDTNVDSYSVLDYSTADEAGATSTYAHEQSDLANATKNHSITLTNLEPGTSYHYKAKSFYFPQAVGASDDLTFATKAPAILPQLLDVKTDSFRLIWKTNSPASSIVQYTDKQTGATNTHNDNTLTTNHDVTIENLTPGDTYEVLVSGTDGNGTNIAAEKPITVTTSLDTIPPTVTSLKIDSTLVPGRSNIIQSVVSWKTDKPSTSVVLYDEGSGSVNEPLRNKIQDTSSYVQNHVIVLPDLKPATIYRIQIASTDQAGNTTTLPTRTIVTPQQAESIVDIIFKNFGATFPFLNGQ